MTFGTIKMTPEFMAEMDALDPKRGTTLQMSVTTDGSDVSREDAEAQVRKWLQARREGKSKVMTSFIEEPREPKTIQQLIDEVRAVKRLVDELDRPSLKKVRRGCPNVGQMCGCLGICDDLIEVPLDDPRPAVMP